MSRISLAFLLMLFIINLGCKAEIKKKTDDGNKNKVETNVKKLEINNLQQLTLATKKKDQNINDYVNVYYFHGNFRCRSCHLIETMTKEVIRNNFKNHLAMKTLRFKIINIEETDNKHFIKDYGLYSKAVVLSLIQDNKEIKYKNLNKVWSYLGNEKTFKDYVESEIKAFLKDSE